MPHGVVEWFDPATRKGAVARRGQVFPVPAGEMEPGCRHPGTRVTFDIHREGGVATAVGVRRRSGTRVGPRHRRFGTLVGAHRPDAKDGAGAPGESPRHLEHPLEVVAGWATRVAAGDLEGALARCAPDLVVHTREAEVTGRPDLGRWLATIPATNSGEQAEVRGLGDGTVLVGWRSVPLSIRSRLVHGRIVEQWAEPPSGGEVTETGDGTRMRIEVATAGAVTTEDVAYARDQIAQLAHLVDEPILFARVRLTQEPDPARDRPARAQALLDVNGDLVRAQVTASSLREAADLVHQRLRHRLAHRAQRRKEQRHATGIADPGHWRHGDLPTRRPPHIDRPGDERQLVRHKTFSLGRLAPEEAVEEMERLDFDFHLFVDLTTDQDSVVERLPDGSYRLTRLEPTGTDRHPGTPLQVTSTPAPSLTVAQALERLDAGHEAFVFFANAASKRGNVAYRRYDGHDGLIVPA